MLVRLVVSQYVSRPEEAVGVRTEMGVSCSDTSQQVIHHTSSSWGSPDDLRGLVRILGENALVFRGP